MAVNADRKKYIDEKIAGGSKLSRIELGKQWDEQQRYKNLSWEEKVNESFPAYAFWLSPDSGGFGAEMGAFLREAVEKEYSPDGYNIGMNCGESAGQTVFHFHCHVIPRYIGDMKNPRGGVRHCINGKGYY